MSEFTAKQVRACAYTCLRGSKARRMLYAYADSIERSQAGVTAVPVGFVKHYPQAHPDMGVIIRAELTQEVIDGALLYTTPQQPITRTEAETFLVEYHKQVWEAAEKGGTDYDMAGVDLAEKFLARFDATTPSQPVNVPDETKRMVDLIKSTSSVTLKDGTGAMDALYLLAVKHGANEREAAGFAHHANGAMNLLQGDIFNLARLAAAPQPASVPETAWRNAGIDLADEFDQIHGHLAIHLTDDEEEVMFWVSEALHAIAPQPPAQEKDHE